MHIEFWEFSSYRLEGHTHRVVKHWRHPNNTFPKTKYSTKSAATMLLQNMYHKSLKQNNRQKIAHGRRPYRITRNIRQGSARTTPICYSKSLCILKDIQAQRNAQSSTLNSISAPKQTHKYQNYYKQHHWIANSTPQLQPVQGLWHEIERSVTSVVEIELWAHRFLEGTHIEFWEIWSYRVEDTQLEFWSTDDIPRNHFPKLNTQQSSAQQCVYKTKAIIIFHMAWIVENNRPIATNFHPQVVFCTESCDIILVATDGFVIDILPCKTKLTCDLKSKKSVTSVVEIGFSHC